MGGSTRNEHEEEGDRPHDLAEKEESVSDYSDLIGLPNYPLSELKRKREFRRETGKPIEDDGLAALLRMIHLQLPFKAGYCYSNVERIVLNARANEFKVVPYAGWLLIGPTKPVHHAWAVFDGKVIDFSALKDSARIAEEFNKKWAPVVEERREAALALGSHEEQREAWVQFQMDSRKAWIEHEKPYIEGDIIENRVWGVPAEGYAYIGCPCLPDEARVIFNKWHEKYGATSDHAAPGQRTPAQLIEAGLDDEARRGIEGRA